MSQIGMINNAIFVPGTLVQTVTTDAGTIVGPDLANNIFIYGGTNMDVVGTPLVNTLTINLEPNITVTSATATDFYTFNAAKHLRLSNEEILAQGTDADIDIDIYPKGTGRVNVLDLYSSGTIQALGSVLSPIFDTNDPISGVTLHGTTLSADGTDVNIDIEITPKGGGSVVVSTLGEGAILSNALGRFISSGSGVIGEVLTSNGPGFIPSWQHNDTMAWSRELASPVVMLEDHGYVQANAGPGLTTLLLPVAADLGSTIELIGESAGGWRIAQGAGQYIQYGNIATTVGAGGSLTSSNRYDTVTLRCSIADTAWSVVSSVGVLLVV
jgi:hypothetical protein